MDLVQTWILAPGFWPTWLAAPKAGAEPPGEVTLPEDVDCMQRLAGGDESALQELFDRWKLPLLGFFYRSLGSTADAEDLTLEVFIRLHRAAADYRPQAKFTTYLFQIARNLILNELRRRRRKPALPAGPEVFDYVEAEHGESPRKLAELEEVFQRALERLPEKYRTPLLLLKQQQLDYPTTAAALRMTENALRVLVHRGRQLLKTEMETVV